MRGMRARAAFGLLLISAGVLFLLQNLGFLEQAGALFWTLAFIVAGGVFMYVYLSDRSLWWTPIPGFSLLGIGGLIAIDTYLPRYSDVFGAPLLLAGISLSFWVIYLNKREQWWAIIPGGVLLTLAVFVGLDALIKGEGVIGLFFIGLGLTFLLVARLATEKSMQWANVPAAVLLIMGAIFLVAAVSYLQLIGSVALIAVGLYLIFRTFRATV